MTCGACERKTPPVFSEMVAPHPGAAPICLICDRLMCGRCKTSLIAGTETRCPNCRSHWKQWFSEP